jgi:predicted ATP-grasp superfamily ATP-dependent carboligase
MKVLVTDSNYKHTLGIIRALGKRGIDVYVLSEDSNSLAIQSKYCKGEICINNPTEFDSEIVNLILTNNIKCILPVGINSYKRFYKFKNKLDEIGVFCPLADKNKFDICVSKYETLHLAEKLKVPVPKTILLNKNNIKNLIKEMQYPCVLKAEQEIGGSIVKYIKRPADIQTILDKTLSEHPNMLISDFLLQEYIRGEGYGFFAVYNKGKCGATFQHRRLREMPPSGGHSVSAESVFDNQLMEYGKKILDELKWHGVGMVEFKKTNKGDFVLMEVNPKFWGSLDLALEAGVNFPYELVKLAQDKSLEFSNTYHINFRYHWPLHGDFLHALVNPKNLFMVLLDTLNPKCQSNLWIFDDIKPTLFLLISSFIKLIRKIF